MSGLNRENFQPVLLWKGKVDLDANGRARVQVPLSDALTSFKLVAIATDGAGLFGTGEASIRSAQDLSIFSGVPRRWRAPATASARSSRCATDRPSRCA
ncbi:MAG: alpha-2-macroglobulin family protein [Sphingomonas sp.]